VDFPVAPVAFEYFIASVIVFNAPAVFAASVPLAIIAGCTVLIIHYALALAQPFQIFTFIAQTARFVEIRAFSIFFPVFIAADIRLCSVQIIIGSFSIIQVGFEQTLIALSPIDIILYPIALLHAINPLPIVPDPPFLNELFADPTGLVPYQTALVPFFPVIVKAGPMALPLIITIVPLISSIV
jgi:hypothetical protein